MLSGRCSHEVFRLPVLIRMLKNCTPEVAAVLDALIRETMKRNSQTDGEQSLHGGEVNSEIDYKEPAAACDQGTGD